MKPIFAVPVVVVAGVIVAAALLVTRDSGADNAAAAGGGPRAWLDTPAEGKQFAAGRALAIRWHASAAGGLRQVEVRANGARIALAADLDQSANLVSRRHEWTPPAAGDYLIEVIATGSDGAEGTPSRNRILVLGAAAGGGPAVAAPAATQQPSTSAATVQPTRPAPTAVQTGAATVAPSNSTAPPASAATATRTVAAAAATPTPSRTPVPATSTRTPTKTPVPDTRCLPAPVTISPKNNVVIPTCPAPTVLLRWQMVSDASGIVDYRVRLERKTGPNSWTPVQLPSPVTTSLSLDVADHVDCGDAYRWSVGARDGAGNPRAVLRLGRVRHDLALRGTPRCPRRLTSARREPPRPGPDEPRLRLPQRVRHQSRR